uniref:Peptidase S1 domain-containing protein n=1 Tax=Ornithorhynchus anatinus TaxID=9258 RepID=A0A6I8NXK1_ORNAN
MNPNIFLALGLALLLSAALSPEAKPWEGEVKEEEEAADEGCSDNSPPSAPALPAALFFRTKYQCSAVMVNERWVLTAAHCRRPRFWVRAGSQLRFSGRLFPHPNFTSAGPNGPHDNDLMLLRLWRPLSGVGRQPLALPSVCPGPWTRCSLATWTPGPGGHRALRSTPSSLICNNDCRSLLGMGVTENMLCAAPPSGSREECQGNSPGGPLLCDGQLYGLVSWGGQPCPSAESPGVFTSICKYLDWIQETMRNN